METRNSWKIRGNTRNAVDRRSLEILLKIALRKFEVTTCSARNRLDFGLLGNANSLGKMSNTDGEFLASKSIARFGLAERKDFDVLAFNEILQRGAVHWNVTDKIARVEFWNRARTVVRIEIGLKVELQSS